ncbi:hypothetical protein [Flagellimonas nanhaiensis]|uniref:Uncharacterized protein n=1 Tax=Flagellimonas nanhaiensis TaxID=2292706 RepID=A0A371JLC8_9FLAO|nr:hypothetical protein [Allomuricauda nanhaiensis]RDY57721.1 hypothetical protein DX873_17640 [Allomuricauda nanhaiensis]
MITLSKIKSYVLSNGSRILKVLQYGPRTAVEVSPFGVDSNPLKDMTAVYSKTAEMGEPVILGYINKNQISKQGETRIYSLGSDGNLAFSVHLKTDGTIEIGGNSDFMVKFNPLDAGLKNQDTQINTELGKIATAITSLGGSYVPTPITTNIDQSKLSNVKTS